MLPLVSNAHSGQVYNKENYRCQGSFEVAQNLRVSCGWKIAVAKYYTRVHTASADVHIEQVLELRCRRHFRKILLVLSGIYSNTVQQRATNGL